MVEDFRKNRFKGITRSNKETVVVNTEEVRSIVSTLRSEGKRLGITQFNIEGLPLYIGVRKDHLVKNWGHPIFRRGWKMIDLIAKSLAKEGMAVEVSALIDDTTRVKSARDEFIWEELSRRLVQAEFQGMPVFSSLHTVIFDRKGTLESTFSTSNKCSVRDAYYQRGKIINQDGSLKTDRLNIIVHPSEFTDQQRNMYFWLNKLLVDEEAFQGVSDEDRQKFIAASFRNIWIDNKGLVKKGITYPGPQNNGSFDFPELK